MVCVDVSTGKGAREDWRFGGCLINGPFEFGQGQNRRWIHGRRSFCNPLQKGLKRQLAGIRLSTERCRCALPDFDDSHVRHVRIIPLDLIAWQGLEAADEINGAWSGVPGAAAPTHAVSLDATRKFYRVRLPEFSVPLPESAVGDRSCLNPMKAMQSKPPTFSARNASSSALGDSMLEGAT